MLIVLDDYDFQVLKDEILHYGSASFHVGISSSVNLAEKVEERDRLFDSIEQFLLGKVVCDNETRQ